jgi:hypothetical protein
MHSHWVVFASARHRGYSPSPWNSRYFQSTNWNTAKFVTHAKKLVRTGARSKRLEWGLFNDITTIAARKRCGNQSKVCEDFEHSANLWSSRQLRYLAAIRRKNMELMTEAAHQSILFDKLHYGALFYLSTALLAAEQEALSREWKVVIGRVVSDLMAPRELEPWQTAPEDASWRDKVLQIVIQVEGAQPGEKHSVEQMRNARSSRVRDSRELGVVREGKPDERLPTTPKKASPPMFSKKPSVPILRALGGLKEGRRIRRGGWRVKARKRRARLLSRPSTYTQCGVTKPQLFTADRESWTKDYRSILEHERTLTVQSQQQQDPVELKDNPSFRKVESEFAEAKEAIATIQNEIKELHELIATFRDPTTVEAAQGSEATPPQRTETQMEADFKDLLAALLNRKAGNEGFPFVKDTDGPIRTIKFKFDAGSRNLVTIYHGVTLRRYKLMLHLCAWDRSLSYPPAISRWGLHSTFPMIGCGRGQRGGPRATSSLSVFFFTSAFISIVCAHYKGSMSTRFL